MEEISSFFSSFFGGLSFNERILPNIFRLIIYFGLIAYFEVMLYTTHSHKSIYIISAVVSLIIFLVKLFLWIIRRIVSRTIAPTTNVRRPKKKYPPENFSLEIWNLRNSLLYPKTQIDDIVNDFIIAGYDIAEILRLYDFICSDDYLKYLDDDNDNEKYDFNMIDQPSNVISICGKRIKIPFSGNEDDSIFPMNFSLISCIFAVIFSFTAQILVFLLSNELKNREKWFIGIVCGFGVYSILQWPYTDPYVTTLPDEWCSCARVLAISCVCGIWYGCLSAKNKSKFIELPFYDWKLKWNIIYPYIDVICRYGLILYPFLFLIGIYGHPVSFMVSLIEAFNRYAFGQNGVSGISHMIIQFLRGAITTSLIWLVLKYCNLNYAKCISLAISSFLNILPLHKLKKKNYLFKILYPLIASILAFGISCLVIFVLDNPFKYIKWISFIWFSIFDFLIPLLCCNHKYFFVHFRVLKSFAFESVLRFISSSLIAPFYISCCIKNSSLNSIIIALLLTNSVQKVHSESHLFCFVIFISLFTLQYDFDYNDLSSNLAISLLIVEKLETFFPVLDLFQHSFDPSDLDDEFDGFVSLICNFILSFISNIPLVCSIIKVPSLIWSFFTGTSFSQYYSLNTLLPVQPLILSPGPFRPFYFFDWPISENVDLKVAITKGSSEHPVETPIYISVCRALKKHFGLMCRQGILGLVNTGDIFLFKSESLSAYVHVISIEPDRYKIQLRGLEFNDQTICHQGENRHLVEIVDGYQFPNFTTAKIATHFAVDVRALSVPLEIYNYSSTEIESAFIGTDLYTMKYSFLFSLCFYINKDKDLNIDTENIDFVDSQKSNQYIELADNKMQSILDFYNINFPEEKMMKYKQIYAAICLLIFEQNNAINFSNIYDAFKGNIHFNDILNNIDDSSILYDFINNVIKFGTGLSFMASSGMFSSDSEINEICEYMEEFSDEYVITRIDSDEFQNAFIDSKKIILSVENVKGEISMLRFTLSMTNWNIYQMKHEWIRSLWSYDIRYLLFYHNTSSERNTIQFNGRFFNNIIIQACDLPNGYPAYVSEIMDSDINPFNLKKF